VGEQLCLRWEDRRSFLRRPAQVIDPREYDVAKLDRNPAKAFVAQHHYQGTFSADRRRFGLYRRGALVGAAVFAHPTQGEVPVLSRFVLLDEVPGNGETWFLARCFAELAREPASEGFDVVDSFSDPTPRTTLDGRTVMPGHVGTIYQAFNGRHVGRSCARTLYLLPDGTVLNDRSLQKIRAREKTWRSAAAPLIAAGADPLRDGDDSTWWLNYWRPKLTRPMRHPGNLKYVWGVTDAGRAQVAKMPKLPYPKRGDT
jgi:hypothetical protein